MFYILYIHKCFMIVQMYIVVTPTQGTSSSGPAKWSVLKKSGTGSQQATMSYIDPNDLMTIQNSGGGSVGGGDQMNYCDQLGLDDDSVGGRRVRRMACTCPNCKDGCKK